MGAGGDMGGFAGKLRLGRGKQMGVATSRFGQVLVSERFAEEGQNRERYWGRGAKRAGVGPGKKG